MSMAEAAQNIPRTPISTGAESLLAAECGEVLEGRASQLVSTRKKGRMLWTGARDPRGLWTFSWERLRSSCCLVGLLEPAALLIAPRSALGEVTFRLLALLFLAAPSNLGFPKPVMRPPLLLGAALPLCELTELALVLLLPPKPCIRLCTKARHPG